MSKFTFVQPIIQFESPSVDIKKIVDRVYDFWDKNIRNETLDSGGYQIRLIEKETGHVDGIVAPEINTLLQEGISNAVTEYVRALNVRSEESDSTKIWIRNVWFNVSPPGTRHKTHIHGGTHLHGIFYLQAPEDSGETIVVNPNKTGLENVFPTANSDVNLIARRGLGYLFSSMLPHYTDPNHSDADRISLSFTIQLDTSTGSSHM